MRDGQPLWPVEESTLQKITLEKRPGRVGDDSGERHFHFTSGQFLRGERGIAVHGLDMLGERLAGEVQNIALQVPPSASRHYTLMDEVTHPVSLIAMVK